MIYLFTYDLFMLQNLHSCFMTHFSQQGSRKNRYLWNMPDLQTYKKSIWDVKKWVRGSWTVLFQVGSFREQRYHHMTSSHPSNVCALYRKWGSMQNLVANRLPGELEHCSGSLSSSGNLLFSCLTTPLPLCSRSPIAHANLLLCKILSAPVFLLHVNVSICLVSWFPRQDLIRRVGPTYASPG